MKQEYYTIIKEKLLKSEIYNRVRDYAKDRNKVKAYYEIGELLSKAGKEYGKNIIKQYSEKLVIEVGKNYNERNLRYMRQFYDLIEKTKWNAMRSKLCWTHYREVLKIKNIDEIIFYLNEASNKNLTQRQLHEIIKLNTYNRIPLNISNSKNDIKNVEAQDLIPNPIIIKSDIKNELNEYALKQLIINDIDSFMLQLGYGFTYVGHEYRIKIGDRYNYIDILLFNIKYNAYVVVELKVTEFKVEYLSQVQKYMNYIDKNIKEINNNNTIGILICKKENRYVIEYCSDERIAIREYELV